MKKAEQVSLEEARNAAVATVEKVATRVFQTYIGKEAEKNLFDRVEHAIYEKVFSLLGIDRSFGRLEVRRESPIYTTIKNAVNQTIDSYKPKNFKLTAEEKKRFGKVYREEYLRQLSLRIKELAGREANRDAESVVLDISTKLGIRTNLEG